MNRQKVKPYAFLLLVFLAGCASAYDNYSCGRVNFGYRPPNAMSWSNSQNGNFTDTPGQEYMAHPGLNRSSGLTSEDLTNSIEKGDPTTEADANSGEQALSAWEFTGDSQQKSVLIEKVE